MSVVPASGSRTAHVAPQAGPLSLATADLGMPILIVPGLRNSGPAHWQSHWQKQMPDSRRIAQPDWFNPDPLAWAAVLAREIDAAPEPPMIIAHSFGCLATIHAAFSGARIRAALLVAPADPERFGIGAELACKPLPFASTLVASSNDPWLKLIRAGTLAAAWGSQFVLYRNAGHINAESGFGPWPQGLTHVHELARRAVQGGLSERAASPFAN
jgi:predicted alpha/beta hydrolase family esterase